MKYKIIFMIKNKNIIKNFIIFNVYNLINIVEFICFLNNYGMN